MYLFQKIKKAKHAKKKRKNYLLRLTHKSKNGQNRPVELVDKLSSNGPFKPGDIVRVRSKEEIQATLDGWNQLKGCAFMEEMWRYYGTKQKVFKSVNKFLDERDYLIKKCKNIYLQEGVVCEGIKDIAECDRSCFFFWREEWLEKIE